MNNAFTPTNPTRWMVVDDNPDLLAFMRLVLEQLHDGSVDAYNSPEAALAAFADAPGQYELVITDFEMPGMNGMELCRRMRAMAGDLKIFLATGSGFFTEAAAARAGFIGLLNKPFPIDKLCAMLAKAGVRFNEPIAA